MVKKTQTSQKIRNRKAYHDYEILDKMEVGLVLTGTEVKSLRAGKANFKDSFAKISNGELWLYNMHISPYSHGNMWNHESIRMRKLLMHKKEIRKLQTQTDEKGLTLVPLGIYFKNGEIYS